MIQLTIDMPEGALAALNQDPGSLSGNCGWLRQSNGMKCVASPRDGQPRSLASPVASLLRP